MKIDGSCHCGFIKYEAEVNPDEVYICHCTDCQLISGSPFRWAVSVPEEHFTLLSGEPKAYVKKADSGVTSHQLFCPECASPLYSTAIGDGPESYNLRLGTQGASIHDSTPSRCIRADACGRRRSRLDVGL